MKGKTKPIGTIRIIWSAVFGFGLMLGLLWALMPHSAAEAQSVNPGFTIDLAYNAVWGLVNPGDTITVSRTAGGTAFGAAEADGVGFFWTPLWEPSGQPADVVAGDTLEVYVNGALAATLNPLDISGQVDVLNDLVTGTVSGLTPGTQVTVTLGDFDRLSIDVPHVVAAVIVGGDFAADFAGIADIGAHELARVQYRDGSNNTVQGYVYPSEVFRIDQWNAVHGYAPLGSPVTVTIYMTYPTDYVQEQIVAAWPHGAYRVDHEIGYDEVVEVDLGNSIVISLTANSLEIYPDATADLVRGQAPPGAAVRGYVWDQVEDIYVYDSTIVDGTGNFTLTLSIDLRARNWVYVAYADAEGDEVGYAAPPPHIRAYPIWDFVYAMADHPHQTVSYTLNTGSDLYTDTGWCGMTNNCDSAYFPSVEPGHVVTAELSGRTMVMTVADVSLQADTANDSAYGNVDIQGRLDVFAEQWNAQEYPIHGQAEAGIGVVSAFATSFPGFDVRDGMVLWGSHYDMNDQRTLARGDSRYLQVKPPWGVGAPQFSDTEILTATLFESDGLTLKYETSLDDSDDPEWYWLYMDDQIAPGDWITVTDDAGWTAGLQVPDMTVQASPDADIIWGAAPKALIYVETEGMDSDLSLFVPSDGYILDTAFFGHDLEWGDYVAANYQAPNGNRVRHDFDWPQIIAYYNMDAQNSIWGDYAVVGNNVFITLTQVGSGVIATGTATPGACSWCSPQQYELDLPDGTVVPGITVTVDFGDGLVDSMIVLPIDAEANADTDVVTITAPISTTLFMNADNAHSGWWDSSEQTIGASGYVTFDLGAHGYDIIPGTDFNVHSAQEHSHNTHYGFRLAAPDLQIYKWLPGGYARPGGVVVYSIYYSNQGDAIAENVQVVDTLPPSTTYAGDTSGVAPTVGGGIVTWNLGDVAPGENAAFMVTLNVIGTASTGVISPNCVLITSDVPDRDPDDDQDCSDPVDVWEDDVELDVDKWSETWQPMPGQELLYTIRWCNNRGAAAGPVWLTDTLPFSTTFISWSPQNRWEVFWEVSATGDQVVLRAPGLPGDWCEDIRLTLLLDPRVDISTTLQNDVAIATPGESELWNNTDTDTDALVGPERYDLRIHKSLNSGQLVPGGWVNYSIDYHNDGNVETHVWITDTLPTGLTFEYAEWGGGQPNEGERLPAPTIVGDQLIWDLGMVGVGGNVWFHIQANISPTVAPGTVITNWVEIGHDGDETWPDDNVDYQRIVVNDPGPNLRVSKSHWWDGDGQLDYTITFENVGDQTINDVWITDALPVSTTWGGWWYLSFDDSRLVTYTESSNLLAWKFSELYPGDAGALDFEVDLDEPGVLMRWYTNTVEISTPPGDVVPEDNVYDDRAFSGQAQLAVVTQDPEGDPVYAWVELWNDWGEYWSTSSNPPDWHAMFGGLEHGDYWVRAWPAFSDRPALANSKIKPVTVGADLTTFTVTLQYPNVIGAVTTPEGDPLPPAYRQDGTLALYPAAVQFHDMDWNMDLRVATSITGGFGLALPDGEYDLHGHPDRRTNLAFTYTRSHWKSFTLPDAGGSPLDLGQVRLTYPRVWGTVVTPQGERVSTWVSLWSDDDYWDGDETYWYGPEHQDNEYFGFGGLPDGHYYVRAEPPWTNPEGYGFSDIYEFDVPPTVTQRITLTLQAANFVGDVLFPLGSNCPDCPVQWVDARIHDTGWTFEDWATTGDDGRFAFSGLAPGVYTVEVFLPDYLLVEWAMLEPVTFTLGSPDDQIGHTFYLEPALHTKRAIGTVVYEDGTPVGDADRDGTGDAQVYAYQIDPDTGRWADTHSDPGGNYDLFLSGGVWKLGVEPTHKDVDWYFDSSWEQWAVFTLDETEPETQTIVLTVTQGVFFQVTGVVTTPDGSPVPADTWVDLCTDEGSCFGASVASGGSFEVWALPDIYEIWVSVAPDAELAPPANNGKLVFVDEDPEDIGTFHLRARTASLRGRVIDISSQQGVEGVTMGAWTAAGDFVSGETISNGTYLLDVLPGYWHGGPLLSPEQVDEYVVWPPHYRDGYVAAGETISNVNFFLQPRNASIRGTVVDEHGTTLTDLDAVVYAERCGNQDCWIVDETAVRGGSFKLNVVGDLTYTIDIWLPAGGYMPGPNVPVEVFVDVGQTRTGVQIELLEAGTRIHGYVLDRLLNPVRIEASVYGSEPEGDYWVEDELWPSKLPYKYNLYVPTPATGNVTWTVRLWVDPGTGYIADPAHPSYEVVVGSDDEDIPNIVYVKKLETVIIGTITAGGAPTPYIWVFAEGAPGTDSEGLYFEAQTDATGVYTMPVLPGEYAIGAYLPPHLASDYLPPAVGEWSSVADNPVDLAFRPRAGREVVISGSFSIIPPGSLPGDAQIYVVGWSEEGDFGWVTGTLDGGYSLPATTNATWHVWAAYEDPVNDIFYTVDEEVVVDVANADLPNVDLVLVLAGFEFPDSVCWTFDPSQFKRLSLPAWSNLPEPLVEIQAGTFSVNGSVEVCATPAIAVPDGQYLVGFAYELEAKDNNGNLITQNFNKKVRLIFYFDAPSLGDADPEDLKVAFYSTARQEWVSLNDVFIDPEDLFATGKMNHFSRFGVFSSPPQGGTQTTVYLPLVMRDLQAE